MSIDAELDLAEKDISELETLRTELANAIAELDDVDRKAEQILKSLTLTGA